MTDTSPATATTPSSSAGVRTTDLATTKGGRGLVTPQGRTVISDTVVAKIAGIAARDVSGVYALGGGGSRAVGAIRERIPGASTNHAQGVSVEVGEQQAAADIDVVAEYGVALADLAAGIRRNVITSVERMTGLEVVEVNVTINDVRLDDGSDEGAQPPRVQ